MMECKILNFDLGGLRGDKAYNQLAKEKEFTLYDFPAIEARINRYLNENWKISNCSLERDTQALSKWGYICVVLTR